MTVEPGSKDRLVQVIGSDEATIELAKSLIEETIQRNASPEPVEVTTSTTSETNNNNTWISRMSGKAELGTYSYTVEVRKYLNSKKENFARIFNKFSWCSGYHIRLTRGRSPVRSRAKT